MHTTWEKFLTHPIKAPLLDLRSPKEYALGHVPTAINLPLLDNSERHEVGLCYKTQSKNLAVQMGLELFAQKAQNFLDSISLLAPSNEVALYCWRGGMRSQLVGMWLTSMGFRVQVLQGGYKNFRKWVLHSLDFLAEHELVVLHGKTGSGKTLLLHDLQEEGLPAIDLEGIANHRGSAFGGLCQKEPPVTQQNFENLLATSYQKVKTAPRILLEIENFIGPIRLPPLLREKIAKAKMVVVERDFEDRVDLLTKIYTQTWDAFCDTVFEKKLSLVQKYLSKIHHTEILHSVHTREFATAIRLLLVERYDKTYGKSLQKKALQIFASFNLTKDEAKAKEFLRGYLKHGILRWEI